MDNRRKLANFAPENQDRLMKYKAALFDLDGVLIDSETLYTQFWERVGQSHHLPSPTFAYDIKGTTLTEILATHFPDPQVQADVNRMLHEFENEIVYPVFPGALEFVDYLRGLGMKTVIVTSSDDKKMEFLFSQHPASMTRCLQGAAKAGCSPEECIVFEDSFQGLEAGRRAGAYVIALSTTNPASSLEGKADAVVPALGNAREALPF